MNAPTYCETYRKGERVTLHPATDAWMQGDRYGTVASFGAHRERVSVRLDSGRLRTFHLRDLAPVE